MMAYCSAVHYPQGEEYDVPLQFSHSRKNRLNLN